VTGAWRDSVTAAVREAARALILPRFGRLRPDEITDKSVSPDKVDLVTVVDREVEEWLTMRLAALDPGAVVIGEEAVHANPDLLDRLEGDEPVWLVDPIDGTKNFARGDDGFGVMLARVERGRTQAAWLMLPARHRLFEAQAGAGAWLDTRAVRVPSGEATGPLSGTLMVRYMPPALRARVVGELTGRFDIVQDSACAAVEYTDVLAGRRDFIVYYRLLPWDHAAPALILTEAGGVVEHLDGRPYSVRSANQVTIVARSREVADAIRRHL
jgi:fructose-1,6-bisphosphatase/inositol monophosphatase family enzyme